MLIKEEYLQLISSQRTDEVVITTMGMAVPWAEISTHPLDFASVGSAMGHAADLALGIALAKPDKKIIVFNGDGSMLMCLGTLATITGLSEPPSNFLLFVCDNGTYEVTGNQPVPRNPDFNWTTIAMGTGFQQVHEYDDIETLETDLPSILKKPGPTFVNLLTEQANEPPPDRWGGFQYPYLQESLAASAHKLRKELASSM